ncbi:MAG: LysM peptidoglycan-binding domain-containing protein [Bacillota bacterium]|nr:LysM peptidoglycan-binding domain-containing protein [Bacillota bacterium]
MNHKFINRNTFFKAAIAAIFLFTSISITTEQYTQKVTFPKILYYKTYTVQEGDTLSQIAERFKSKDTELTNYIAEIEYQNNRSSSEVMAGEVLQIPIEE